MRMVMPSRILCLASGLTLCVLGAPSSPTRSPGRVDSIAIGGPSGIVAAALLPLIVAAPYRLETKEMLLQRAAEARSKGYMLRSNDVERVPFKTEVQGLLLSSQFDS